ncbi:MAG: zinc-binding dehydrogenase [Ignavibacteriales bacterium]|nr:zinc-binding dehydrogenase [Ignavibacteriales bacterium]
MKSIRFHEFGNADVLRFEEAPKPTINDNEVLIQLKAASLNHLDIWVRSGTRERNTPLPHIPGSDGAGIVAEVGKQVSVPLGNVASVKVGERVLISPGLSCGECSYCKQQRENLCSQYRVLGTRESGTYAEFVQLPARNVFPIPEKINFNEAAAFPLVFLTAYHMLITLAQLQEGETVLIHGAGSGVGIAAIQIAKLFNAKIITTAGSDEKLQQAKNLGADEVINYNEKNFSDEVKRITDRKGVDVVFEHIGGDVFEKSIFLLRKGGRLVTCGATKGYEAKLDLRYLYSRHLTLLGSFMGTSNDLKSVLALLAEGKLKPIIDSVFPLAKAADAQRRMEERKQFGKIILEI